jgi:hypothetical protein
MPLFEVTVRGRGLWIEIDAKVERVGFQVTRVVDADDVAGAGEKALALVRADPKARQLPGRPPPTILASKVVRAASVPDIAPGFRFFPDP